MNSPAYADAWNDYRRRRRLLLATVCAFAAFMAILTKNHWPVVIGIAFIGLVVVPVGLYVIDFRCPRCGQQFFVVRRHGNGWARRCLHCGLKKWAESEAA